MTVWILGYLTCGALLSALMYHAVDKGIEMRDKSADMDEAMRELEKPAGSLPGGMVTILIVCALIWPAFLIMAIRNMIKGSGR